MGGPVLARLKRNKLVLDNNTSQCGSRFRGVWEDPDVGSLTSTGISARRDADSKRPTKQDFVKTFCKRKVLRKR